MLKLCRKLMLISLVIIIPTIFSFVATTFFHEYFANGEYAIVDVQNEYEKNDHTYNRVLIMGDSVAQSSYIPKDLSNDVYNLSLGGETPVDGYFRLAEYLENHEAPEYLFCSYNPSEFSTPRFIWKGIISSTGIPLDMAMKIMEDAKNYEDSELNRDHSKLQALACHYGVYPDSVVANIKALFYNIFQGSCYERYVEQRDWVIEHRGQWPYYTKGGKNDDVRKLPMLKDGSFYAADMMETYMKRIISLCEEKGIAFIYETVPFNESSYNHVDPIYKESYAAFWRNISKEYPNATLNGDICFYSDIYFSDNCHLNLDGADKFTKHIREKYSDIFEEAQL